MQFWDPSQTKYSPWCEVPGYVRYREQRRILRDRRSSTAGCLAYWAMGTNEYCTVRKKIYFELGRLGQSRQDKNLLYWRDKPKEPTKEEPFQMYSLSPHSP